MNEVLVVLLSVICCVCCSTSGCADIDDMFCSTVLKRIPEACHHKCLSKYCQKTCGVCPLECYTCSNTENVANCSTVSFCPNIDDVCFVAQTFTDRFQEIYKSGCGPRETCLQYSSDHGGHIEAGCCDTNRCNNKPPVLLQLLHNNSAVFDSAVWNTSSCVDRDEYICQLLSYLITDSCSDECIASRLCPKMCQTCFSCLDCSEVKSPELCEKTTTCGRGQVCYSFEKLGSDFRPAYQLGCINKQECVRLHVSPNNGFGKRSLSISGYCCNGEKCNANRTAPTATVHSHSETTTALPSKPTVPQTTMHSTSGPTVLQTTTPIPIVTSPETSPITTHHQNIPSSCVLQGQTNSHCPVFYNTYINNICYHKGIDGEYVQRAMAEERCRKNCGTLLSFTTLHEMRQTFTSFNYNKYGDVVIWIGMIKASDGSWVWSHDNSRVSSSLLPNEMTTATCAVAYQHFDIHTFDYLFDVKAVTCSEYHHTVCRHV